MGGGDGKLASYSGVNGASRLLFSYTVVEGHEDANGISINANKLTHNGATIVDAADSTKNAVLTHGVEAADPDHKVDGVRQVFQSATIFPADPDRIVLRYDESLSPSLAPTAFEVTVNGETRNPDSVTHFPVDGVTFVFGSDFRAGESGLDVDSEQRAGPGERSRSSPQATARSPSRCRSGRWRRRTGTYSRTRRARRSRDRRGSRWRMRVCTRTRTGRPRGALA